MDYQVIIGLEVHAQLKTATKIFCGCPVSQDAEPNTNVCPICLGHPGVLPVLNKKVVDYALMVAIALNCEIKEQSTFDRKNYFYPDLPKGYQITQFFNPLAENGNIKIETKEGKKPIRIKELHIEEDAGKSFHPEGSSFPYTLIDMNRSGIPLVEIVSQPDMRSPEEAVAYLKRLRQLLRYLDVSDCDMEKGNFRCDANLSLRFNDGRIGTRREVKNLNSFKAVERALNYEVTLQEKTINSGKELLSETLAWDERKEVTFPMRLKETFADYRYFPEPDLPPLKVTTDRLNQLKTSLPELPWNRKTRFIREYGLREYEAGILTGDFHLADYFEQCANLFDDYTLLANWFVTEVLRELSQRKISPQDFPVSPQHLAQLMTLLESNKLTAQTAKQVFAIMVEEGGEPSEIADRESLFQLSSQAELESIVDDILESHPKEVKAYKGGKTKLLGFFIGQVMYRTQGKANPQLTRQILQKRLGQ